MGINVKPTKVIFLSMRMHGRNIDDICATRDKMREVIRAMYPNETLGFIDNINCDIAIAPDMLEEGRLLYLGEAIKKMAYCNAIAVINGDYNYGNKPGCEIEEHAARVYGLRRIELTETGDGAFYPDLCNKYNEECRKYAVKAAEAEPSCDYENPNYEGEVNE